MQTVRASVGSVWCESAADVVLWREDVAWRRSAGMPLRKQPSRMSCCWAVLGCTPLLRPEHRLCFICASSDMSIARIRRSLSVAVDNDGTGIADIC